MSKIGHYLNTSSVNTYQAALLRRINKHNDTNLHDSELVLFHMTNGMETNLDVLANLMELDDDWFLAAVDNAQGIIDLNNEEMEND